MGYFGFGWRDGVLLIAALTAVYLALSLLKLAQLRRHRTPSDEAVHSPAIAAPPQFMDFPPAAPAIPDPDPTEAPASFGDRLAARVGFDDEMERLRGEVESLRREVAELRAARRVSPQYSDAMALAQRGYDARGIAAECGISVGEAELVSALSRNAANIDDEVSDGGDDRDTATGFAGR
ncbi:MAG: DUF2802 domain-containing protein [Candidatus Nitricoxidivorans perseverans]|uniref:DUF2802 domain-containing protein n=1 Tax=Candidatus Nitricoxidivorans perseverans TaxID=2975601 RepID=A0AA49FKB7_9PROT|nr:MAG: DUF2802 domain-containing protein [Candidatus Nitricoxidivorans perseverans]